jgi:lactoylglutathione lyase
MIKGLYETHLYVADLERSIEFYKQLPGLTFCHYEEKRRIAFFWIGKPKQAMLGLWEKPKSEIDIRHFAFECSPEYILHEAIPFLINKNLQPYNFLKDGTRQPMVFAWMPAVAIYFNDPDEHILEFIAILEGTGKPELGVIAYDEWCNRQP